MKCITFLTQLSKILMNKGMPKQNHLQRTFSKQTKSGEKDRLLGKTTDRCLRKRFSSLEVQLVKPEDYGKVLAIRQGIYGGYDYLPDHLRHILENPSSQGYAGKVAEQIVAFCIFSVIDDGQTVVPRSARVSKDYKGRGYYEQLKTYVMQPFYTGNKRFIAEAFHESQQLMLESIDRGEYSLTMKMNMRHYTIETNEIDLKYLRERYKPNFTRILSAEDLKNIFRSTKTCSKLFPENRMVGFNVPYRLLESNIPMILFESSFVVGSFTPDCVLFTCGTYFCCDVGLVCNIEIYGEADQLLREHLLLYLKYAPADVNISKDIEFITLYREDQGVDIDREYKKHHFQRKSDIPYDFLYAAEKGLTNF